jgi:hypothetical protein
MFDVLVTDRKLGLGRVLLGISPKVESIIDMRFQLSRAKLSLNSGDLRVSLFLCLVGVGVGSGLPGLLQGSSPGPCLVV